MRNILCCGESDTIKVTEVIILWGLVRPTVNAMPTNAVQTFPGTLTIQAIKLILVPWELNSDQVRETSASRYQRSRIKRGGPFRRRRFGAGQLGAGHLGAVSYFFFRVMKKKQ